MDRPKRASTHLIRLAIGGFGLVLAIALAISVAPTYAAGISVAPGIVAINGADGQCSLIEAIINANTDTATHPDCAAGSGPDTIIFPAASTYNLTSGFVNYGGDTGLPLITTDITFDGNGSTINRSAGTFRLLAVTNSGTLTINSMTLSNGLRASSSGGGAIFNDSGSVTINDSILSGNSATNSEGGGAIRTTSGTVTINRTTFTGNSSGNSNGGGAIYATGTPTITINQSTFDNNSTPNTSGGALALVGGTTTITNSTISGNSAQGNGGGGIYNTGAALTLNNSTVSNNTSTNAGGGLLLNGGTTTLNRSIVVGNTAPAYTGSEIVMYSGTFTANNYNVFGHNGLANGNAFAGVSPGANDFNATTNGAVPTALANILNTTLANNGGPTQTNALVAGSPAIDFGPSAACTAAPINGVDQRGAPRNVDGDASASSNECDSGAYEYGSSVETPTSTPTDTPTITPSSTPTDTPTITPSNTPSSTPTDTPTITPSSTPTDTPTNTPIPLTSTPTDTPTNTPIPLTSTPTDTPTNTPIPLTSTPTSTPTNTPIPDSNYCPETPQVSFRQTDLLGTGQGSPTKGFRTRKLVIPNAQDLDSLYGQLAAVDVGVMKYVRFRYPNGTNVQIYAPTSPAFRTYAVDWWGSELTPSNYIKGQFFWGNKGNKAPRAFVLWPTYVTTRAYANVFQTFDQSIDNHVYWDEANGWVADITQIIPIPTTQAAGADVVVRVALVDNNKDGRPVVLTLTAGGVAHIIADTVPNAKDTLNLYEITLNDVPAGTSSVELNLVSPAPFQVGPGWSTDAQGGDSVAMIGAAVSYACEEPLR